MHRSWLFAAVLLFAAPAWAHWPESPSPVLDAHLTFDSKGNGGVEVGAGYGSTRWAFEGVGAVIWNFDDSALYAVGLRPMYSIASWLDAGIELLGGYESSSTYGGNARLVASGIVRARYKVVSFYWQPTFISTNTLNDLGSPSKLALRFGVGVSF